MNALGVRPSFATGFAQGPGESEYPDLWRGLVAAYDPSLGQTGSRLIDWSGKGNHGTLVADTHWVRGPYGWVLDFDGAGDNVIIEHNESIDFQSSSFSVCSQVVPRPPDTTPSHWVGIVKKANNNKYNVFSGYQLGTTGGSDATWANRYFTARIGDGIARKDADDTITIASHGTGQIHHVVMTVNRATNELKLYVNNSLRKTTDISSLGDLNVAADLIFGKDYNVWNGQIDHVLIYNRALIPAEISFLHQLRKQVA